jgi:hypothetical protein
LRKGSRLSKFQSKCDEGFLLGYFSNSKAYRVYNKSKGFVEEAYDVQFDETMGSQDEKENLDDVRGEELSKAMKTMAIGDIMPREEDDNEDPSISIQANPSTSTTNDQNQQEGNSSNNDSLKKMIKWPLLLPFLHQLKNRLINQEFIIKSSKITPLTKLWVTLVRVFKLDLVLLHFVNIILLYLFMSLSV